MLALKLPSKIKKGSSENAYSEMKMAGATVVRQGTSPSTQVGFVPSAAYLTATPTTLSSSFRESPPQGGSDPSNGPGAPEVLAENTVEARGDSVLSREHLEALERDFDVPARDEDEESLALTEISVNPGLHATKRLAERRIPEEQIQLAKKKGRLILTIEQKRGGDPKLTTYQLRCKRASLHWFGSIVTRRFPDIVANEPAEKGNYIDGRLEMRLGGSEGLGPDVKRLLDDEGFGSPCFCARCKHVHVCRLKFVHEISDTSTIVVVEQRVVDRHSPTSVWHIVTTYKSEKPLLPLRAESDRGVLAREHTRAEVRGGWCSRTPVAYDPHNISTSDPKIVVYVDEWGRSPDLMGKGRLKLI